jgi:Ca2+-binding RTX toxin-like protein
VATPNSRRHCGVEHGPVRVYKGTINDDTITGGTGNDSLDGGEGNDSIVGARATTP